MKIDHELTGKRILIRNYQKIVDELADSFKDYYLTKLSV